MDGVRFSVEGLAAFNEAMDKRIALADNLAPIHDVLGLYMVRSIKKNFREGGRPSPWIPSRFAAARGGQTLRWRGRLQQSITHSADRSGATVGTNVVYARIQQEGGVIKPKNKKALAIPVDKSAWGKSPKEFQNLVFIPRKGKNPLLVEMKTKRGKASSMKIMFVLMKSVRIPARPFLLFQPEDYAYMLRRVDRMIMTGESPQPEGGG